MQLKTGIVLVAGLASIGMFPLWGQQAGHAGGSGRPVAAPSAPAAVPARVARPNASIGANRTIGGRPYPLPSNVAPPTGLISPAASYTGITPGAFSNNGSRRNNNGRYPVVGVFGTGYPGYFGAPYVPYLDQAPISTFPGYAEQAAELNAQMNSQGYDPALAQQLDEMNNQIRQLRQNQMQNMQLPPPGYFAPPPQPNPAPTSEADAPQAPIVLVFQNGGQVSTRSYAVMNGTVWDFSKQPARKIPLTSVDIAASTKATEASGGEFPQIALGKQ